MSENAAESDPSVEGAPTEKNFESCLSALEDRVRRIDAGELPLEEALQLFEEGVALARECHERLDAVEQRIIELTGNSDPST
jgi:exodeoxyribonuclease VII small subunit